MVLGVKKPFASAGEVRDMSSVPELGSHPEEGDGYPLQWSCLDKSTDRGL